MQRWNARIIENLSPLKLTYPISWYFIREQKSISAPLTLDRSHNSRQTDIPKFYSSISIEHGSRNGSNTESNMFYTVERYTENFFSRCQINIWENTTATSLSWRYTPKDVSTLTKCVLWDVNPLTETRHVALDDTWALYCLPPNPSFIATNLLQPTGSSQLFAVKVTSHCQLIYAKDKQKGEDMELPNKTMTDLCWMSNGNGQRIKGSRTSVFLTYMQYMFNLHFLHLNGINYSNIWDEDGQLIL